MTIPSGSNFPTNYDDDTNLYLVHDSLRMQLAEDYTPGATSITVTGDVDVMAKFPPTGIITLTEQCSEPELRAISFFYGSKTTTTFDQLELMPGFVDVSKSKLRTNVTQNVYADHHNALKDACIAIEEFIGVKGIEDVKPFGDTLVGRLNFLRRLILTPRAWFTSNKRIGIVPLTVTFVDESFRGPTSFLWDFGDGTSDTVSTSPSATASVASNLSVITTSGELDDIITTTIPCGDIKPATLSERTISHTYFTPGKYDVKLTAGNKFGRDTITIPEMIIARAEAPDEAQLLFSPSKIRTNQLVTIEVVDNGAQPYDPIEDYTWKLSDDLPHNSSPEAVALYSVGGIYDVKLRVDTELGAYRITTVEDAINVVEQTNLWLMAFDSKSNDDQVSKSLYTYEFGLTSESWKSEVMPTLAVSRDHSFISGSYNNREYQKNVFRHNVGFAHTGSVTSGDRGEGILHWAEDENTIRFKKFKPFEELWESASLDVGETQTRNWNWLSFTDSTNIYILFGLDSVTGSPSSINSNKTSHNMGDGSFSNTSFGSGNFLNGAEELEDLPDAAPATYRSAFKGTNGFFARNDSGPGSFFRIRSFYRTEGALGDYATDIRKLTDIPGTARTELEIVPLTSGIFVFNNSGEVAAYSPTTNVWTTGGPGIGSAAFRSLQDASVDGFADISQPMLAASDGDRRAYLSFGYSQNTMVKFNESDLTFSALSARPTSNEQYVMTVF